jgi:hypothetical protein
MSLIKDKILALRKQNKSFGEIQKELGCSKSLIAYYCSDGQKEKLLHRTSRARKQRKAYLVELKGGKCQCCGYDKCFSALEFHHLDSKEKEFAIGDCQSFDLNVLRREAEKCVLVCSNCHREIHEGLRVV